MATRQPPRKGGTEDTTFKNKSADYDANTLTIDKMITQVSTILKVEVGGQYYPVYHIPISKFNGIEITGRFITTDASDEGSVSYVTVGRQAANSAVGDGFGFAWRKSSLIPETYDSDGAVSTQQYAWNCYIVDNNILNQNTFINNENLLIAGGINNYIGGSNFLTYGRRNIEPNTTYKFKLQISSNYQTTVWILDDGLDFDLVEDVAYSADPNTGVPTNQYGYVVKRGATDPLYSPNANGTHFGVSVLNTQNYEWRYSEIDIKSITDDYAASMFKLDADPTYLSDGDAFAIYWKGWGQWDDGEADERGASLFVRNITTNEWEVVGTNTAAQTSPTTDKIIRGSYDDIVDYRDGNNFVTMLALATNADSASEINTQYVSIDNVSPSGIHTGGMIDIYLNDPDNISTDSVDILVPIAGTVQLSTANGFQLPVHSITSILSAVTGVELVEGVDYIRVVSEPTKAWSTSTSITLSFTNAPANVTVSYRYYTQGAIIQAFVESEEYRNPVLDPLIKIKPPAIITANVLEYRGDVDVDYLKTTLATWVNSLTTSIEVADLINKMYLEGVDYVNLTTLDISRRTFDYEGTLLQDAQDTPDSYTLSGMQAFYADELTFYGLTKLG